jgi:ribulose-5-phosphate 4-epimerase/fuculose-1-phosphate aldolase
MVSEINSLNSESEIASLIKIGKAVVDRGLVVGSGGNLSMLLKGGKELEILLRDQQSPHLSIAYI